MKFKVGDRVKFVKSIICHTKDVKLGECYTIQEIYREDYRVECGEWFKEEELKTPVYTYEDLEKSPIGTKITFENGTVLVKDEEDYFENVSRSRNIAHLCNLKDNYSSFGKIIKIEEPEYKTVYESKVEILDETEKRYLRGVIRPFRSKVLQIAKKYDHFTELEYIRIIIKDDVSLEFPSFSKNTMYKSMELDKKYTLEELGL